MTFDTRTEVVADAVACLLLAGEAELLARRSIQEQLAAVLVLRRDSISQARRAFVQVCGWKTAPPSPSSESETSLPGLRTRLEALRTESSVPSQSGPSTPETEEWLIRAIGLLMRSAALDDSRSRQIADTLFSSVLRPLSIALAMACPGSTESIAQRIAEALAVNGAPPTGMEEDLVALTLSVEVDSKAILETREAGAALSRLCWESQSPAKHELESLWERLDSSEPRVEVVWGGPYLISGLVAITDYLGVPFATHGRAAFCRCGQSATKPFCDGSHALSGFVGDKDPRRVPDRLDRYDGQQVVILDNRGSCAHSGFCTDRLKTVFHLNEEPFITPSGDRMDNIVRAVRRCPSGALGAAIDDRELREFVDRARKPAIEISRNGPYRLTGSVPVFDHQGLPVPRNASSSEEHCSLCRCGSSLNKPFCSGMHWSTGFSDPAPPADRTPTLFEWAGGYPALFDTTTIFYSRHVPSDPLIGPLFARMEPDHPERVAGWLSEVFGGPSFYSDRYGGYARMISQHLNKHLTNEQRSHWARLMAQSADEAGLPSDPEFRAAFVAYIEWGSRMPSRTRPLAQNLPKSCRCRSGGGFAMPLPTRGSPPSRHLRPMNLRMRSQ